jgi:hypothetical protein
MYTTESIFPAWLPIPSAQTIQLELTAQEAQNYMYQVSIREGVSRGLTEYWRGGGGVYGSGAASGGGGISILQVKGPFLKTNF